MIRALAVPGVALGLVVAAATPAAAQTGLVVVAHGADSVWNGKVREVVESVAWRHGPVEVAFLMGGEAHTAGWDSALTRLVARGARRVVAVPLLVSSFSGHYRQIEYYAGARDTIDAALLRMHHVDLVPPPLPVTVTAALDSAPELREAVVDRWRALDARDRAAPLVLVAHGPNDDDEAARWLAHLHRVAAAVVAAGAPSAQVHLLRDDAAAEVRAAAVGVMRNSVAVLAAAHGDSAVALPILVSSGGIANVKIPRDLEGLPVRYHALPLAPHPVLSRWIARVAEAYIDNTVGQ